MMHDVRFREYRMDQVDVIEEVKNKLEESEDSDISEDSDNCCVDYIHLIVAGPKELSGKCKRHIAAVTLRASIKLDGLTNTGQTQQYVWLS